MRGSAENQLLSWILKAFRSGYQILPFSHHGIAKTALKYFINSPYSCLKQLDREPTKFLATKEGCFTFHQRRYLSQRSGYQRNKQFMFISSSGGQLPGDTCEQSVIFYELFQRSLYFLLKCHTMPTPKALLIMKVLFTSVYVFPSHFFPSLLSLHGIQTETLYFSLTPPTPLTGDRWLALGRHRGGSYDFHEFLFHSLFP